MADEKSSDSFWVQDICVLFTNFEIIPTGKMSRDEKLNAITRLAIIVSLIMYVLDYEHWFLVLVLSLFGIVLLKYGGKDEAKYSNTKENFTITPTYQGL